ncbi:MAG TPA: molybdopterin-dependent oxidoreductase [Geobacteraceae bacterium]|nr:molybdopterin-dependent oxidoreductase [Geobacteraceae bacterium]
MPKLIIDNIEVEVPPDTKLIEAARQAGIVIPHFCYHPALGSAGACRMCAVKCLEGPVKGIQMSCMIPAQDGMVVSTTDEEAVKMRSLVIEWLMINHPHDCPVCDEGGECLLQDYTVAGGHGIRRYKGKKRTHINQFLGDHIEHEMNRCIQCYRCVRFYQEFAGGTDLGALGRANMMYYGRKESGTLELPFSGNLVDICPTGVYTDKTARFRARYWDYDMAPSVCPHCSLGCNTIPAARYRELLKTMARRNDAVNGWFICDSGRFSNHQVNSPDRPRCPMVDGREAGWDEAMDTLVTRIGEMLELHGEESLALVGSSRMSLEGNVLLARLAEAMNTGFLCYFNDEAEAEMATKAVSLLDGDRAISMGEIQSADCVVLAACDLMVEGPMMALAVRQAWRGGAKVFLAGADLSAIEGKGFPFEFAVLGSIDEVPFTEFKKPVIICGTASGNINVLLAAAEKPARLAFLLNGPDAFGAALMAAENRTAALSAALATGKVKGLIVFEADVPENLPREVRLLAVADWQSSNLVERAEVFLPVTAHVEMDGTFINNEGRAQRFRKVMTPGLPIKGLDPAVHPPRVHRRMPPGGDLQPSWRIIAGLMERFGGEKIEEPLTGRWAALRNLDPEGTGMKVGHMAKSDWQRKSPE